MAAGLMAAGLTEAVAARVVGLAAAWAMGSAAAWGMPIQRLARPAMLMLAPACRLVRRRAGVVLAMQAPALKGSRVLRTGLMGLRLGWLG